MDAGVIAILDDAGIDTSLRGVLPRIRVQLAGSGRLEPLESRVTVEAGEAFVSVDLLQRLSRSAGHFTTDVASTNYIRTVGEHL